MITVEGPGFRGTPASTPRSRLNPMIRSLLQAPSRLYDWGLGPLLGSRFLRLTHTGRRTGRAHRTVLEVVGRDRSTGSVVVVAGLGPAADWYRNVLARPRVLVEVGSRRFRAAARVLDTDEAAVVLTEYERRNRWLHPLVRRLLTRLASEPYDGSPEALRRVVEQLPLVEFRPDTSS
jgi:deazaflavin-dependent oxidoreductase (nitroreductase family)